ncbi:MAG: hypothetical protein C5B49_00225 [Bdellovibrio sp.]|nr:MAG: hypothetical protein C5B49_00225 [Bdellovibrio sp.]
MDKTEVSRRILLCLPTLLAITMISFCALNLLPGTAQELRRFDLQTAAPIITPMAAPAVAPMAAPKKLSVAADYFAWLARIAHLDFGESTLYGEDVSSVILAKVGTSLSLGFFTFLLMLTVAIPWGFLCAVRAGTVFDIASRALILAVLALPPVALATTLLKFFSFDLHWFPSGGLFSFDTPAIHKNLTSTVLDLAHHMILPVLSLAATSLAFVALIVRNSVRETLALEHVRSARSRGLHSLTIHRRHVLRNALPPLVAALGSFPQIMIAGSLVVENVFELDGLGRLTYQSIAQRDYNVVMALTLLSSIAMILGRFLSDVFLVRLDPRIDWNS